MIYDGTEPEKPEPCVGFNIKGKSVSIKIFYKKVKNVSCEYDRVNGSNSTLQAAWYIRHVRIIWFS